MQGVVKVLYEQKLLPRVMAGSSVGSIVAAILCTRTDTELDSVFAKIELFDFSFFNNTRTMEIVNHLVSNGERQATVAAPCVVEQLEAPSGAGS